MVRSLLLGWCLVTSAALAEEGYVSGSDLLGWCESDGFANGFCYGYATAITEVLVGSNDGICLPQRIGRERLVEVIVDYVRAHPQDSSELAYALVMRSFREAWPCEAE